MLLEPLRNRVKKLESEMLKLNPKDSQIIKRCARGDTDAFRADFLNLDMTSNDLDEVEWDTAEHGQFYVACRELKSAEREELKAAFVAAR